MKNIAIETNEVTKAYEQVRALDALTLRIEEGEVFGLLGHNGAGKTTTVRPGLWSLRAMRASLNARGCTHPAGSLPMSS